MFLMRPPSATKRVANSVEFMGQMVSYPQYIRLMRIQKEVINMDKANMQLLYKGGLKKVGLPRLSESYLCKIVQLAYHVCIN